MDDIDGKKFQITLCYLFNYFSVKKTLCDSLQLINNIQCYPKEVKLIPVHWIFGRASVNIFI